jgi:hypothetical protein
MSRLMKLRNRPPGPIEKQRKPAYPRAIGLVLALAGTACPTRTNPSGVALPVSNAAPGGEPPAVFDATPQRDGRVDAATAGTKPSPADCDPNFCFDAHGSKHFKPECSATPPKPTATPKDLRL